MPPRRQTNDCELGTKRGKRKGTRTREEAETCGGRSRAPGRTEITIAAVHASRPTHTRTHSRQPRLVVLIARFRGEEKGTGVDEPAVRADVLGNPEGMRIRRRPFLLLSRTSSCSSSSSSRSSASLLPTIPPKREKNASDATADSSLPRLTPLSNNHAEAACRTLGRCATNPATPLVHITRAHEAPRTPKCLPLRSRAHTKSSSAKRFGPTPLVKARTFILRGCLPPRQSVVPHAETRPTTPTFVHPRAACALGCSVALLAQLRPSAYVPYPLHACLSTHPNTDNSG